jgi:hypothetical protein
MPQELQIIRASEFIRFGAHGHFDLAASKAALAELVRACRKRGIDQAMMDLRALHPGPKPVFTPADLAALVSTFREIGFTHEQRLAVLYGADPHHRARLFAFLSTMHGWSVRAFGDFEKALLWLSEAQETKARRKRSTGAKEVPVQFLKRGETSRPHRLRTAAMVVLLPAALATLASCSSTPKVEKATAVAYREGVPGGTWVETYKITASVVAIDAANRRVTLVAPDGSRNTFTAEPGDRTFDQLRVGDPVQATVTRQLVVFRRRDGVPPNDGQTTGAVPAPDGAQAGVLRADTVQRSATVTVVDRKGRQATLQFPDGTCRSFAVRKDVDLQQVTPGEEVVIRTSSAVVLKLDKP